MYVHASPYPFVKVIIVTSAWCWHLDL